METAAPLQLPDAPGAGPAPEPYVPGQVAEEVQRPFFGFEDDDYDPMVEPRFALPSTRAGMYGRLRAVAPFIMPRVPTALRGAGVVANAVGGALGYPQIRDYTDYLADPMLPYYLGALTYGVYPALQWLYTNRQSQKALGRQLKLAELAKKYPRVLGRQSFNAPPPAGNG